MTNRSTWEITDKTWHGRLYLYWREHALYKKNNYRENLCHYVRVIVFWGPLAVLINWIPIITSIGVFVYYLINDAKVTLMATVGALAFSGFIVGTVWVLDKHQDKISNWLTDQYWNWFRNCAFKTGASIAWLMTPLTLAFKKLWKLGSKRINIGAVDYLLVLIVLIILATATAFGSLIIGVIFYPLQMALSLIYVLVICVLLIGSASLIKNHVRPLKDDSIVYVLKDTVIAKKHRICPLIDVVEIE